LAIGTAAKRAQAGTDGFEESFVGGELVVDFLSGSGKDNSSKTEKCSSTKKLGRGTLHGLSDCRKSLPVARIMH
jgi:hypothetical protein